MSGSDRGDRPALVVLGLLVASIVFVSLLGVWGRHEAEHASRCYADAGSNQEQIKEYNPVCPDEHMFFGDGYAQWIMAVFSAVATGASIWAVILLKDTLAATRDAVRAADDAVEVTREMGRRQMRAYVEASSPTVFDFAVGRAPYIRYRPQNAGQTPAKQFRQTTTWRIVDNPNAAQIRFGPIVMDRGVDDIGAGTHLEQRTNLPLLTQELFDDIMAGRKFLLFCGVIKYRDVFGVQRRTVFRRYAAVRTYSDLSMAMNACAKNNRGT